MSNKKVFIIAEAGVNHNGYLQNAFKLVDIAVESGADAVKFQTFIEGECTGKFAIKVEYLDDTTNSDQTRYELTQSLVLPFEDFVKLKEYCDEEGIVFLTTPDGIESLKFVVEELKVGMLKVSSTELTNIPFLEVVAKSGLPLIISTGLGSLGEVEQAVRAIEKINNKISILHCTSEYPAPIDEININAIKTMREAFKMPVGFSDHSEGYEAGVAAVALGAEIIEKHFTIDRSMPGPDHKASLNPIELTEFVRKIRNTEKLLGDGVKKAMPSEIKNIEGIRRSVVSSRNLNAGYIIKETDLLFKRPGYGVKPVDCNKIIGLKLTKSVEEDEPITWNHFK